MEKYNADPKVRAEMIYRAKSRDHNSIANKTKSIEAKKQRYKQNKSIRERKS